MFLSLLPKNSIRQVIATNTLFQLVGKAASVVSIFVLTYVLASKFGAYEYGNFTKITTFVGFFFLFADFGLNAIYVNSRNNAFPYLLGLRTAGGIALMFVAVLLGIRFGNISETAYPPSVVVGIGLFAPVILFQALITSANGLFQKNLHYKKTALAALGGSVITLIVALLIWIDAIPKTIPHVGIVSLGLGSLVSCVISLIFIKQVGALRVSFAPYHLRQLLYPAIPLGIALLFNVVYSHVDSVILAFNRSTQEVGTYGLAYKIFETVLVIPTFFMNALYPLLVTLHKDQQKAYALIGKASRLLFVVAVVFVLCVWSVAPLLVVIRDDFGPSVLYLRVLSISFPVYFMSSLTMWLLVLYKQNKALLWIYGSGMVINIFLNIVWVPVFGALAASWVTLVGEVWILFWSYLAIKSFVLPNKIR